MRVSALLQNLNNQFPDEWLGGGCRFDQDAVTGTTRAECSTSTFANFATRGSATGNSLIYHRVQRPFSKVSAAIFVNYITANSWGILLPQEKILCYFIEPFENSTDNQETDF